MTALLTDNLPLLAGAPNGIKKLRELILELAVHGKLVPQDSNDGQASDWLGRIEIEKAQLLEAGLLKKTKKVTNVELDFGVTKVPNSWGWVTLSDITLGMDSGWSPACEPNPSPNNDIWGVLKTTAVQVMQFLQEENKELPSHLEPRPDAEVKAGDILFTRAGPTNRVGISCLVESTRPRLMISDKIIRFHPIEAGVYGRYVALCLNAGSTARYLEIAKSGMAASQVNISQEKLKLAPVPLAPLPEQHRIVAKVDELMGLCDRLEAQQSDAESAHTRLVQTLLDSLTQANDATDFAANWQRLAEHFHTLFTTEPSIDALKQTLLQLAVMGKLVPQDPNDESVSTILPNSDSTKEALHLTNQNRESRPFRIPTQWRWEMLNRLLERGREISYGIIKLGIEPKQDGIPTLRCSDVKPGYIDLHAVRKVSQEIERDYTRTRLTGGEVVINIRGTLGGVALVNAELAGYNVAREVAVIPVSKTLSGRYMAIAMQSNYFWSSITEELRGIAYKGLNLSSLRLFPIPIPPVQEQHRIVTKIDQLTGICDQLKSQLNLASKLNEKLTDHLVKEVLA